MNKRRRHPWPWLLICLAAVLSGLAVGSTVSVAADSAEQLPPAEQLPLVEALVTRVIDGATLDAQVHGARTPVGYLGVSVPDLNQPCGAQAFERNRELTAQGVLLEADPMYVVDERHRVLFYAYTPDGVSIDETLILEGLAHATRPDAAHGAELAAIEADTAAQGLGCLWAAPI